MEVLKNCNLCPRNCGADRTSSFGFCKVGNRIKIARAALHFWEEPAISGTLGSGTIFFCGCNLRCVYCQNHQISHENFGKEISVYRLAEIFLELQEKSAHNINLVSPTPYVPFIIEAIDMVRNRIKIPFVYNTSGYEKSETLDMLKGYIDIFLTDIKYKDPHLSQKYSFSADYFDYSLSALEKMIEIAGKPVFCKNGLLQSGVILRHLVLPTMRNDSFGILDEVSKRFSKTDFLLSLMRQYTPPDGPLKDYPEINRPVTTFEYLSVVERAISLGLDNGYTQEKGCAQTKYTPPFDLSGV